MQRLGRIKLIVSFSGFIFARRNKGEGGVFGFLFLDREGVRRKGFIKLSPSKQGGPEKLTINFTWPCSIPFLTLKSSRRQKSCVTPWYNHSPSGKINLF